MSETERTSPRRRLRGDERRARILGAAVEVFAEQGYERAAMSEIARRAGVVPSVLYDHFASKRALHAELLERHGETLIERSISEVVVTTPRETLEASVAAFYRFMSRDPFVWRFLFRDPPADPDTAAVHARIHERATAGLAALVLAGAPPGAAVAGVPRERAAWMLARLAQGATNGLAAWWYEHPEVPEEEIVAISMALLWEGFRGLAEGGAA